MVEDLKISGFLDVEHDVYFQVMSDVQLVLVDNKNEKIVDNKGTIVLEELIDYIPISVVFDPLDFEIKVYDFVVVV